MSDAPWCCYLFPTEKEPEGDPEKPCGEDAEWVIWDGQEPAYDHEVHGCTPHVGELLTDSDHPHQVYPVAWVPQMEKHPITSVLPDPSIRMVLARTRKSERERP